MIDREVLIHLTCSECGADVLVPYGFLLTILHGTVLAREAEPDLRHSAPGNPCRGTLRLPEGLGCGGTASASAD